MCISCTAFKNLCSCCFLVTPAGWTEFVIHFIPLFVQKHALNDTTSIIQSSKLIKKKAETAVRGKTTGFMNSCTANYALFIFLHDLKGKVIKLLPAANCQQPL